MRSVAARSRTSCRRAWASGGGCCARAPWRQRTSGTRRWRCWRCGAAPASNGCGREILWQQRDWPRLAAGIEALLKARDPAAPLSGADQELVIRLAIAHARREEHGALADLRARFGPAMRGQAAEPAFLMATAAPGMAGSERPAERQVLLAEAAEHLARVRAYLASELTSP